MDKTGNTQLNLHDEIYTVRLNLNGVPIPNVESLKEGVGQERNLDEPQGCGSCYGAETPSQPCCNTCDGRTSCSLQLKMAEVRLAYNRKGWAFSNDNKFSQVSTRIINHNLVVPKGGTRCHFARTTE